MRDAAPNREGRPVVEVLEGRTMASFSPSLDGSGTFPTHTTVTVDAGQLGQPITFNVNVFAAGTPFTPVGVYFHGQLVQQLYPSDPDLTRSSYPRFPLTNQATYTIPAGAAVAEMFGVGLHTVIVRTPESSSYEFHTTFLPSTAVAVFRVTRPRFVRQPSGVGIETLAAGSGPALQAGDTGTIQYNAYLASTYRMFSTTATQTPDTETFTVDATPEQVIPGLDAGVIGMQAGETRAIYIPYALAYGMKGASDVPPRANVVFLVTLVSIG